jgi:hypothetical protein
MHSSADGFLRGLLLCVIISPLIFSSFAAAQAGKPTEYQVKAAYLFNFGKFVKWPEQTSSDHDTFSICVLGSDPFGKILDSTIAGEQIGGKPVTVRRVTVVSDAGGCRILFVGRSETGRLESILAGLGRSPVLTVSDIDGFANRQGMIQFVMDRDRVRFQVNLSATQKAGLALSSELLKVATAVKGQAGE